MFLEYEHLIDNNLAFEVKLSYIEYIKSGYSVEDTTYLIFEDFSLDENDTEYLDLCLCLLFIQMDSNTLDYDLRQKALNLISLRLESNTNSNFKEIQKLLLDYNNKFLN